MPRAAMAYGPVEYWYSWAGHRAARADFVQRLGVPAPALIEPPALLLRFLRRRAAAPSGMLVRAEVIREVRGFEDAFRGMYEDQAFCAKVCLRRPVVTTATAGGLSRRASVDDAHGEVELADVPTDQLPVDAGQLVDRHPLLSGDVRGVSLRELLLCGRHGRQHEHGRGD